MCIINYGISSIYLKVRLKALALVIVLSLIRINSASYEEEFEDTKGEIRIRIS